ncbi:hypothetical protein BDY21DRAFT_334868 [Lineolata rhizophorae]|uniref:Uncharacterized protein n=1 Tax=Lineolata rhizophorae TaxID=578093 RepID=A0A6A6P8R5_9PEZI|nr:hypothetical protein BDY21DRAFT_334868 [Lineolata rhizophorae]
MPARQPPSPGRRDSIGRRAALSIIPPTLPPEKPSPPRSPPHALPAPTTTFRERSRLAMRRRPLYYIARTPADHSHALRSLAPLRACAACFAPSTAVHLGTPSPAPPPLIRTLAFRGSPFMLRPSSQCLGRTCCFAAAGRQWRPSGTFQSRLVSPRRWPWRRLLPLPAGTPPADSSVPADHLAPAAATTTTTSRTRRE